MTTNATREVYATQGLLAGLIRQRARQRTHALDMAFVSRPRGTEDRWVPPLSCYRTVSQRGLSVPTNFLSLPVQLNWGSGLAYPSYFEDLLTATATGAIPPPAGSSALKFLDSNRQPDRARIVGKVLIGLRAHVIAHIVLGTNIVGPPVARSSASDLGRQLAELVREYVQISIFDSADDDAQSGLVAPVPAPTSGDPWVAPTSLGYFCRPPGHFVAVPPLLWPTYNREPNCQIGVRAADFAPAGVANPDFNNFAVPFFNAAIQATAPQNVNDGYAQLGILVEALFVPPPEACAPGEWPGELCPTHKIGLHPDYDPAIPVFRTTLAGERFGASTAGNRADRCDTCGAARPRTIPRKHGILDPRHNVREAVKQMLLLEDHLFHAGKVCNDCIQKHCLTIEALGEEGVTLDKTAEKRAGKLCGEIATFAEELERRIRGGEQKPVVADDLRAFRKRVAGVLRGLTASD